MFNLINIELKKVFRHKSIYIVLLIMFLFCLFNNLLYKMDYDNDGNYKYEDIVDNDKVIDELEKELELYDANKDNDKNMYVTIKSKLDCSINKSKYDKNSWQYIKYNDYMYEYLYNINYYTYIEKNNDLLLESKNEYNNIVSYFENNNWRYFINLEKDELEENIKDIKEMIDNNLDKELKLELENKYEELYNRLDIINYRLDKSIDYGNNYLNRTIVEYENSIYEIDRIINVNDLNYDDKLEYNNLVGNTNINKYIIDNKTNINKENNLNYQLRDIVSDYELFIIIIILITCSILIGEEFNKGTIKLLLIKPYNRSKILLSKIITEVLVMILSIMFIVLVELVIGGLLFGFDSLNMLVPVYNFNIESISTYNVFIFMLINILAKIPMFIMIIIISNVMGLLINNTVGTFSVVIMLYMFSMVINNIIISYDIKILQYFITLNWEFKNYLFGGIGSFSYLSLKKSILIYIIYVIILLGIMFRGFKYKDIKNI